jgi:hypothetical protein
MEFIDKCKKYLTYISLKYASKIYQHEVTEIGAIKLSRGLIDLNYDFEKFDLKTIKNKLNEEGQFSVIQIQKIQEYFEDLSDGYFKYKHDRMHNIILKTVELDITEILNGEYNSFKVELSKDYFKVQLPSAAWIEFNIMADGRIKLDKIVDQNEQQRRYYIFEDLTELSVYLSNAEENIDVDDTVLKMVLI